jgi:hypothetical protein
MTDQLVTPPDDPREAFRRAIHAAVQAKFKGAKDIRFELGLECPLCRREGYVLSFHTGRVLHNSLYRSAFDNYVACRFYCQKCGGNFHGSRKE